jgi:hypothetical protein
MDEYLELSKAIGAETYREAFTRVAGKTGSVVY